MSRRRHRPPTPDELRLWSAVTQTVAPIGMRAEAPAEPELEPHKPEKPSAKPAPARREPVAPVKAPPLSQIDRRTASRITRGAVALDARIDLHGMTQAAAHGRLLRFLRNAQADGARLVLVITGKGRAPSDTAPVFSAERGVLRRTVPEWLASAEARPFVVGFGEARPAHGGAGALYVRIRRPRGGR